MEKILCLSGITDICIGRLPGITVTFCGYSNSDNLPVELDSVYIQLRYREDTTIYGPMELGFVIPSSEHPNLFFLI